MELVIQDVTALLTGLRDGRLGTFNIANDYLNTSNTRRHELATQAASDHTYRTRDLLTLWREKNDLDSILNKLQEHAVHAEHWHRKFSEWARVDSFDNDYARFVHNQAAQRYREVLAQLDQIKINTHSKERQNQEKEDLRRYIPAEAVKLEPKAFATGSLGTEVFRATYDGKQVVVKRIALSSEEERKRFHKEVATSKDLQHHYIVRFFGANHQTTPYFIVSEYAEKGELIKYLIKVKNEEKKTVVWRKMLDVARGLQYLHSQEIIHGDLKGNNIVVDKEGTAKLTDFGMSYFEWGSCSVQQKKDTLGAMQWRAPEYAIENAEDPSYDSDVYSLGMCIIQAVNYADVPWGRGLKSKDVRKQLQRLQPVVVEKPEAMTNDQWELVKKMIAANREERSKLPDVVNELVKFAKAEEQAEVHEACPYA